MKILVADKLADKAINELKDLGATLTVNADLTADQLPEAIQNHDVIVVRSTKVTGKTIEAGGSLSLIIRAGAGVNTIDVESANRKGIYVTNCPGKNTDAVAEVAIGLLIAADRGIADATQDLRSGHWEKKKYGKARGLKGRTLGIIGVGAIGKAVIKRAKGLEMNVAAWSRSLTEETAEELGVEYCSDYLELAKRSDAVSLHLAAAAETKGMINETFFNQMKDGSILINTSRGEVINTADLKKAIAKKNLRIGLDVFENEPAGGKAEFNDTELASMVCCTPHIGASTDQSTEAIAEEVVRIIEAFKTTGKPINTVNTRTKSENTISLVVRHFNKVGVLAHVLHSLKDENINVEEMENLIFNKNEAASCSLKLDNTPSAKALEEISKDKNIIQVEIKK